MTEIIFYDTEDGKCPVKEYLDSLENNGIMLRAPYSEYLGDGLFELRTKQSSDITRIIYFFFVGNKAILTNGFTKKTRKTPKMELELAHRYKKDYEKRNRHE